MKILFYDTETSDLPLWSQPSSDPAQPHIAQVAAVLVDTDGRRVISEIDLLTQPDGWQCSPETVAIHGITHERAMAEGISEELALQVFYELWYLADLRVGHVESFDARIVRIAMKRFGFPEPLPDEWKDGPAECTGKLARVAMKLKGAKLPKLVDAYRHFTGEELQDAHTARADVQACMRVYWEIKDGAHG